MGEISVGAPEGHEDELAWLKKVQDVDSFFDPDGNLTAATEAGNIGEATRIAGDLGEKKGILVALRVIMRGYRKNKEDIALLGERGGRRVNAGDAAEIAAQENRLQTIGKSLFLQINNIIASLGEGYTYECYYQKGNRISAHQAAQMQLRGVVRGCSPGQRGDYIIRTQPTFISDEPGNLLLIEPGVLESEPLDYEI